jgi:hypothetical protein
MQKDLMKMRTVGYKIKEVLDPSLLQIHVLDGRIVNTKAPIVTWKMDGGLADLWGMRPDKLVDEGGEGFKEES